MRSLPKPLYNAIDVFYQCVNEVAKVDDQNLFKNNRNEIVKAYAQFEQEGKTQAWHNLKKAEHGKPKQIIAGGLNKGMLVDLYSKSMVGAKGDSRDVYDDILVSSDEICPFCGGLGQVRTLDHFLPKAYFPLYSVMPENLFPCCRDCNTDKLAALPKHPREVTINPYYDKDVFFNERWVKAKLLKTEPLSIIFRAEPPKGWLDEDSKRAQHHFIAYDLSRRFSVQGSGELSKVIAARRGALSVLPVKTYKKHLLDQANVKDLDLNGWSRTMYQALADDNWFLSQAF